MTTDPIADELSTINSLLTAAHVALGEIYRQYGVEDGDVLVIDPGDTHAFAAIEGVRSANAQLSAFLDRLPSYN